MHTIVQWGGGERNSGLQCLQQHPFTEGNNEFHKRFPTLVPMLVEGVTSKRREDNSGSQDDGFFHPAVL